MRENNEKTHYGTDASGTKVGEKEGRGLLFPLLQPVDDALI